VLLDVKNVKLNYLFFSNYRWF